MLCSDDEWGKASKRESVNNPCWPIQYSHGPTSYLVHSLILVDSRVSKSEFTVGLNLSSSSFNISPLYLVPVRSVKIVAN